MPYARNFFGFADYPDDDYYYFIRDAFLISLLASFIFWIASFIVDIVRYQVTDKKIDWNEVVTNALTRSFYSFVSTLLLFLLIK